MAKQDLGQVVGPQGPTGNPGTDYLGYDVSEDVYKDALSGFNGKRMMYCSEDTLNTPYKEGLTENPNGLAIFSMSSATNTTIFYICSGTGILFVNSYRDGSWGEWYSIRQNALVYSGSLIVDVTPGEETEFNVTFSNQYTSVPVVMLNAILIRHRGVELFVKTRSTSGFTGSVYYPEGNPASSITVMWLSAGEM